MYALTLGLGGPGPPGSPPDPLLCESSKQRMTQENHPQVYISAQVESWAHLPQNSPDHITLVWILYLYDKTRKQNKATQIISLDSYFKMKGTDIEKYTDT